MAGARSRGQPLLVLVVLISGWIGARALAWTMLAEPAGPVIYAEAEAPAPAVAAYRAVRPTPKRVEVGPTARRATPPLSLAPVLSTPGPSVPDPLLPMTDTRPVPVAPRAAPPDEGGATPQMTTAGGHQLLWLAAAAIMPLPAEVAARLAPPVIARPTGPAGGPLGRWSADGWLYLRRGGGDPATFPRLTSGGAYGSSQAGAVLRYRLSPADPHRPTLYLRGAAALNGTREQEAAVGLAVRPLAGVPIAAMAELRATRNAQGTTARPAVALVTELPPQRLPLGFVGEAYAQAGYVGGRAATAYVDGLMRAERPLGQVAGAGVNAGAGVWGARQRGAARVDVGPVASVRLRIGDAASARLEADWRFRVAGQARPGSGPALTLSAGF